MKIAALLAELADSRSSDGLLHCRRDCFLVLAWICAGEKDLTGIDEWEVRTMRNGFGAICRMKRHPSHNSVSRSIAH